MLESELFGHEKGAFTGAHERRIGRFEQANGGTIFLDEVAEIDSSTQVKLLRVMSEERAFERVGGNQTLRADVRIIAATNKNLEALVREGKFRDDLFFRLNVVRITMPPLRERKDDIPLLVRGFLRHFCKANEKPLIDLTADAMNALLTYNWPGNVRELRTAIEHGVVMATGPKITVRDLPMAVRQAASAALPRGISAAKAFGEKSSPLDLHETEQKLIMQALATTNGNVTAAAKKLGISRRTLHRKINEMNATNASERRGHNRAPTKCRVAQNLFNAQSTRSKPAPSPFGYGAALSRWPSSLSRFIIFITFAASPLRRQWTRRKSAARSPAAMAGEPISCGRAPSANCKRTAKMSRKKSGPTLTTRRCRRWSMPSRSGR